MDELDLGPCPQCGATAEFENWGSVASTHGRVAMTRVRCVDRHTFLMPRSWRLARPRG